MVAVIRIVLWFVAVFTILIGLLSFVEQSLNVLKPLPENYFTALAYKTLTFAVDLTFLGVFLIALAYLLVRVLEWEMGG